MSSSPSLVALHGYHSGPSYCLRSQYISLVLVNGVDADAPSNASRLLAPEALREVGGIMSAGRECTAQPTVRRQQD